MEFLCRFHSSKSDIQNRWMADDDDGDMPPLDVLLASRSTAVHKRVADILWDSGGDEDAVVKLTEFAEGPEFLSILNGAGGGGEEGGGEEEELSNIPRDEKKVRKRRIVKPKRTEEVRAASECE